MARLARSVFRGKVLGILCLFLVVFLAHSLRAQQRESALSDAEVDKLRDTAYYPPDRISAFIDFLDQRTRQIDKLSAGKRQPGRDQDIHDLMEQFTSIAEDLEDNLDDYSQHHRDIRKVLPKVLAAVERWGTSIRTPPDNEAYKIARKFALETLADIHESATRMVEEQKAWFLAHPPPKDDGNAKPRPRT